MHGRGVRDVHRRRLQDPGDRPTSTGAETARTGEEQSAGETDTSTSRDAPSSRDVWGSATRGGPDASTVAATWPPPDAWDLSPSLAGTTTP